MRPSNGQSAVSASDSAAVHRLIEDLVTAWNAGDGDAYGRCFTEQCDYVTFNGDHVSGRTSVASGHQALFETHLRGSKLMFEEVHTRQIDSATILVHGIGNSLLKGRKSPSASRRSIQTLVAVRTGKGWLFTAFHNTRIFRITPLRALLMKFGL